MDIDLAKLEQYERSFLRAFPGDTGFDQSAYIAGEGGYKRELQDIFEQQFSQPLRALPADRAELLALAEELLRLFTKPLQGLDGKPQNLVGWRYISFARKIDESNKLNFLTEVAALLDETQGIEKRLDRFYGALERIAGSAKQKVGVAMKRAIATFFLCLNDPERYVFVKAREFGRAVKDLIGERLYGQSDEYSRLLEFTYAVRDALRERNWTPTDLIDVQSFLWVHQSYQDEGIAGNDPDYEGAEGDVIREDIALNQILYGPPGTGKTYHSVDKALAILDPDFLSENADNRPALKRRFDELKERGRVSFVTFHQSFSYEDFVEGLRATKDDDGQVVYEIEDGIFKRMCDAAGAVVTIASSEPIDISGRRIWKMSLGNTQGADSYVFDDCIQNGRLLLGYGDDIDFSGVVDRSEIADRFRKSGRQVQVNDYAVTAVNTFINSIQTGDLVVVSDGNRKFRAIGEVNGEYDFLEEDRDGYLQSRAVGWLRVYEPSLPYDQLMNNVFSQMTIYELKSGSINLVKLQNLLNAQDSSSPHRRPFSEGEEIKPGHLVARITDELLVIRRPNGVQSPLSWEMLDELTDLVRQNIIDLSDIGDSTIFDGLQTSIDKFIVNGYKNFIPAILSRLLSNTAEQSKEEAANRSWVLIIDEINRGNIASILGELITLIEPSKRATEEEALEVTLPYSKQKFSVPNNLYIIGTMNTADRSLAQLDTALRRRFSFESMLPDINVLRDMGIESIHGVDVPRMLSIMNSRIEVLYNREHTLGHSFFIPLAKDPSLETLERIFRSHVLPLLEEYFFEDWSRIRQVLGDDQKTDSALMFYLPSYSETDVERLFGDDSRGELSDKVFRRNYKALQTPDAFIGIYDLSTIEN